MIENRSVFIAVPFFLAVFFLPVPVVPDCFEACNRVFSRQCSGKSKKLYLSQKYDNVEHKNYILNKIIINSYDETAIIVMKMTILGGPRPPQAAEKMEYFCVLGGNLASVPPLVNHIFGTRGGNTR